MYKCNYNVINAYSGNHRHHIYHTIRKYSTTNRILDQLYPFYEDFLIRCDERGYGDRVSIKTTTTSRKTIVIHKVSRYSSEQNQENVTTNKS